MRRGISLLLPLLAVGCSLTLAAASKSYAQATGDSFTTSDLDKNGRIDRAEYQRRMVEVFYFADKDKDGVVTIEEIVAIEPLDEKAFKAADRDGSGKLTVNEFVAYRMIQFDEADRNKDGVLTAEEVEVWEKR
jgi:Ca2+-binding EF-hand superfamily protein